MILNLQAFDSLKIMKIYIKYLNYLVKHKWYVTVECFKQGLYWRGLVHDLSKFTPREFFPYAQHFYGPFAAQKKRDGSGYYKPTDTGDPAFDIAWLHHQNRNKHHWQYWCCVADDGTVKIYDMPLVYRMEMVCDWNGAGKAQGFKNKDQTKNWYLKNKDKMVLSTVTREWIENEIGIEKQVNIGKQV
jgi:hypothetical protein